MLFTLLGLGAALITYLNGANIALIPALAILGIAIDCNRRNR